jgi:hypothetical protein
VKEDSSGPGIRHWPAIPFPRVIKLFQTASQSKDQDNAGSITEALQAF